MLHRFISVTRLVHGLALSNAATSPEATRRHRCWSATGVWCEELVQIADFTATPSELAKGGFLKPKEGLAATEGNVQEDDYVATCVARFVVQFLAKRIQFTCAASLTFPWAAAGLVDENHANVEACLQKLQTWWTVLQRLDEDALRDPDAGEFRTSLAWPLWVWPREIMLALSEFCFKEV